MRIVTAFGIFLTLFAATSNSIAVEYTITDLGEVCVLDINNSGQIIGNSAYGAFVWNNSTLSIIGNFTAQGINSQGQVVGYQGEQLIKWENGASSVIAENRVGFDENWVNFDRYDGAIKITDSGLIYSTVIRAGDSTPYVGFLGSGSTEWEIMPRSFDDHLLGINNLNQFVGRNVGSDSPYINANGVNTKLLVGEGSGQLNSINDAGQAVGQALLWVDEFASAFIWDNGVVSKLGNGLASSALDINNLGQIVGFSDFNEVAGQHASIWVDGQIYDLNVLLGEENWILTSALAINDLGQIIGTGILNGAEHSFLLNPYSQDPSPTPEPSSILLLCASLAFYWLMKKRFFDVGGKVK